MEADLRSVISDDRTRWPTWFDRAAKSAANDFSISFHPELSAQQVQIALQALADFYRSCGGVGFKIDFELLDVLVGDPEHVRR
jgi:hypothetical protein